MERVKIELPLKILFSYHFKIEENDINDAKHMGNERILVFANNIRTEFFKFVSLKENDATTHLGTIIANHSIQYKSEGFLGDEITCEVGVNNITDYSFDLIFHFLKSNNKTMATVRTGCVYYHYDEKKIQPLPDDFIKVFTT
jgi:acyl-CoA thioesterase FadM